MKQTFYLVRHPQIENPDKILYGRLPFPISRYGRRQAQRMAAWLEDKQIAKIFSSQVYRCQQTSELIQKTTKAKIIFDKRLLERMDASQGMTLKMQKMYHVSDYSLVDMLGGESITDVMRRTADLMKEKLRTEKRPYVICSHGDPLFFIWAYLQKKKIRKVDDIYSSSSYQPKGSITPVEVTHGKITTHPYIQF